MENIKLSDNFSLFEFLESSTARTHKIKEQWDPPVNIIDGLKALCTNLLQPLREAIGGPIIITSGWRCERLNKLIGGAWNSHHLTGEAADCEFDNDNQRIIDVVKELNLPFDQMIDEQHLSWVHLSYLRFQRNRRQMLKMVDGRYEVMK